MTPRLGLQLTMVLVATFAWTPASASPPRYTIVMLEHPTDRSAAACSLNEDGVVVGMVEYQPGRFRPAVWNNSDLSDRTDAHSHREGAALAVNERGEWVGFAGDASSNAVPLYWRSGTILDLDLANHAVARGLDDGERVVGERRVPEDRKLYVDMLPRAFLWENGHLRDIAADIPDEGSVATAVNNQGIVVGWSNCGCRKTPGDRAFVWENGTVKFTGNFGGSESRAFDVNDNGIVVGEAEMLHMSQGQLTRSLRAFQWQGGRLRQIGTLGGSSSTARGINKRNEIVGWSTNAAGETRAFIWQEDPMVDLNVRVDNAAGWIIRRALDINNHGDIAADAEFDGRTRAVVLKVIR